MTLVLPGASGHRATISLVRPARYAGSAVRCISSIIVAGIVGPLLTRDRLIVAGDAAATAQNIAALPALWRLGVAADVVMQLCDVPVMLILFPLLSPINRNVALLANPLQHRSNSDSRREPANPYRRRALGRQ